MITFDDLDDAFAGAAEFDCDEEFALQPMIFDDETIEPEPPSPPPPPVVPVTPPAPAAPGPLRLVANSGQVLISLYTDAEAAVICDRLPTDHSSRHFTQGLIAIVRSGGHLSQGRRYWLHDHARQQVVREAARQTAAAAEVERAAARAARAEVERAARAAREAAEAAARAEAERAAEALRLRAEELRLEAEEEARYGHEPRCFDGTATCQLPRVRDYLAGGARQAEYRNGARVRIRQGLLRIQIRSTDRDRTRWPGGYLFLGMSGFERPEQPLAVVDANGYLFFAHDADRGTLAPMFDLFEEDPREFVVTHPGDEDHCLFCGIKLRDEISTAVKYGPDCAVRWGHPHTRAAADLALARAEARKMVCEAVGT